jgi:hypothetical protein
MRENVIRQTKEAARPETLIWGHAEGIPVFETLIGAIGKRKRKYLREMSKRF